jgi:hypothetical protein
LLDAFAIPGEKKNESCRKKSNAVSQRLMEARRFSMGFMVYAFVQPFAEVVVSP